jgi:hypothetical protein
MGLISEVKCSRCDRRYSGIRSRCPYCGARRTGRGKHAEVTDNSFGKLLVGILILLVLIAAVLVLIISGTGQAPESDAGAGQDIVPTGFETQTGSPDVNTSTSPETTSTVPVVSPSTSPSESPTTTPEAVESVTIEFLGEAKEDITVDSGVVLEMDCVVEPSDTTETPKWESSDTSVFTVTQSGEVTAVGSGIATLTVTVGTVSAECIVRVN